ncbi:putative type IIS restriction /modification enzyme, N-terminal half [Desulfurella amilsii]|uniref:site-specific DNA-methyltransferase (adenine-specific) n=1 Tax=Desulfurella amilsii TaxID=1562698 RepID=A0A1X4Y049_9BACT|nr:TaqI-like C-terminal specificity domain-containing protein [Desulfurella amilsii]OSS43165.1 putative type IIS restriction /modification enzyme, N-terminal half [Desulfurella amilsii]
MSEEYGKKDIRDMLEDQFVLEKFKKFVNILEGFDGSKEFSIPAQYIPDSFRSYVNDYKRIGQYETDKKDEIIDVLVVTLKNEITLERARSAQRNFIRRYLNGGRGNQLRDAALVAFIAKGSDNWRFSFVKMQYSFDERGKIKDDSTPAKRYSFIVGKNESSHTAQSRFLPLILEKKPSLAQIEEAFNVERVTDEFFNSYKALFIKTVDEIENIIKINQSIKNEFTSKNISKVDFAKKLLGQIVFLYFLQKKGWLGVEKDKSWGSGSRDFLRNLFEKAKTENKNFFSDYLEYLFYDALNNERSHQTDPSYHEYLGYRIPFLNGGLFEPYRDYDWKNINLLIPIPNELFSNQDKDGILDVFDLFNFTVKEDEPLEKEVAVDPELLGKIYENLNAIREDNFEEYKKAVKSDESRFNKKYGVYYTPREIVHFMAQNVLVEYLFENLKDKSQDLESLKEDLENFIFHSDKFKENDIKALENQDKIEKGEQKSSKYNPKISTFIQENASIIDNLLENVKIVDPAVGSGAFPIGLMHEIVKAREFLLDLYLKDSKKTAYDFKSHCIQNSLYGVDIDSGAIEITRLRFWLSLVVDEEDLNSIKPLPNLDYKLVAGDSLGQINVDLFRDFDRLEKLTDDYHNVTNFEQKKHLKQEIDKEIYELTGGQKEFDYYVYFSKIMRNGGFDIVMGNPPYIQLQKNHGELANLYERFKYEVFNRMGDIYTLFYEKGIKILKNSGHLCFITSNKWMRAGYGEKLRGFFIKYNPKILVDLGPGVFESATVDTNILLIQNSENKNLLKAISLKKEDKDDISKALNQNGLILSKLSKDAWFIGNNAEQKLKEKIEHIGKPLKDWDVNIYYGIKTGLNEALIIDSKKREEILANCKDEEERKRTEAIIKPILRGRDIKRYHYEWAGLWVIGTFPALHLNIDEYPAIKEYFISYFDIRQLEQSGKKYPELGFDARKKTGNNWFETQDQIAYYPEFEKEKLVWQELAQGAQFAYDTNGEFFISNTGYMLTGNRLKYVLGYFNSKLNEVIYDKWYCTKLGSTGIRWLNQHILEIPIPPTTHSNEPIVKQIESLVDTILDAKKQNPPSDTSHLERQIDQLVYQLYNLTEEEIKITGGIPNG